MARLESARAFSSGIPAGKSVCSPDSPNPSIDELLNEGIGVPQLLLDEMNGAHSESASFDLRRPVVDHQGGVMRTAALKWLGIAGTALVVAAVAFSSMWKSGEEGS